MVWIEISEAKVYGITGKSPPARVVWIEIPALYFVAPSSVVATREGGVD